MRPTIHALISEQGNGFCAPLDYIRCSQTGQLYQVISTGRVEHGPRTEGRPNRITAIVIPAYDRACLASDESTCSIEITES